MPDDTSTTDTNTAAAAPVKSTETIWQEIGDFFKDIPQETHDAVDALASEFEEDVWPYVKHFIGTLLTQAGQAALKVAPAAIALLATGNFGAAAVSVGTAVAAEVVKDAPQDANDTLQAVQAALQVVKVATGTVTPGDAPAVAAIQAAAPAQ